MSGRVIQARYLGGRPGTQLAQMRAPGAPPLAGTLQAKGAPPLPGAPKLPAHALQAKAAHNRPGTPTPPARALQAHGAAESFAVDPVRLGLGQGRGNPLPDAVRAKMEAAFGTDFSRVRVHEGPQAARIGAIAFTTGHDIYFAPGQYRPETVQGQQLLGHELAHVVQQRQGRVRAPGSGVSVVQDHALEAEADRLGMRAALQRMSCDFQNIRGRFLAGHSRSEIGSKSFMQMARIHRLAGRMYFIQRAEEKEERKEHAFNEENDFTDAGLDEWLDVEDEELLVMGLPIDRIKKLRNYKSLSGAANSSIKQEIKVKTWLFDGKKYHISTGPGTAHVTLEQQSKKHYFFERDGDKIKSKTASSSERKKGSSFKFDDLPENVQKFVRENYISLI
jgi:hypothetical protein